MRGTITMSGQILQSMAKYKSIYKYNMKCMNDLLVNIFQMLGPDVYIQVNLDMTYHCKTNFRL